MGFLSNIIYWKESGYFDASSHEKWLLHTWSLSVEWQFYIIYPLVLVTMKKLMSLKVMKAIILIGTVLGFIFCVIATYKWPNPAYYLLPTRAWEMMFGGVAFLYPINIPENRKKGLEWIGLALIISSYIFISKENLWPGYLALIPVLGAFLLIQSQRDDSIITGNIISQSLGKWSYSIYLWHWPIAVAILYYHLSEKLLPLGIFLSIILGFLSNKYIERISFRNNFKKPYDYLRCRPLHYLLTMAFLGFFVFSTHGIPDRLDADLRVKNERAVEAIDDWYYPRPNLKIGDTDIRFIKGTSEKNILFIGASHIEHTYSYVKNTKSQYNIYYVTMGGCFVSPSFTNPKWSCSNIQEYKKIIDKVNFDKIVTSIYFIDGYLSDNEKTKKEQLISRANEYDDFLRFSKDNSNEVYIILGEPKGDEFHPKYSMRYNLKSFITEEEAREAYSLQYSLLNNLVEKKDTTIIDPIDYLCDKICRVMDDDSRYYYKDRNHMRPWYAKTHISYLEQIISQ